MGVHPRVTRGKILNLQLECVSAYTATAPSSNHLKILTPHHMHSLQQLVDVVSKNKVKSIRTLEPRAHEKPDMLHDFYDRLTKGQFADDEEAAEFYGYESASCKAYRKQRAKLADRLYNSVFFIDTASPKFNKHQKAFYNCNRHLSAAKLLLGRGARTAAMTLLKRILVQSKKYELTWITLESYRQLMLHHALVTLDRTRFEKARANVRHFQKIYDHENEAAELYNDFGLDVALGKIDPDILRKKGDNYIAILEQSTKEADSFYLHSIFYFLRLRYCDLFPSHEQRLTVCDEALAYFATKEFVSDYFVGAFYYHKVTSLTQLQRYSQAKKISTKCLVLFEEGSNRWYNSHKFHFILSIHTKDYESASEVYHRVVNTKLFRHRHPNRRQEWILKGAYLYYLHRMNKLPLRAQGKLTRFRLHKFLNDLPQASSKKRKENIPITVLQLLLTVLDRNAEVLHAKTEAAKKYLQRHLDEDLHFRSTNFIRMIVEISKQNFDPSLIREQTSKYLEAITARPLRDANQSDEIEIIPYEHLWEYTLESLDK